MEQKYKIMNRAEKWLEANPFRAFIIWIAFIPVIALNVIGDNMPEILWIHIVFYAYLLCVYVPVLLVYIRYVQKRRRKLRK